MSDYQQLIAQLGPPVLTAALSMFALLAVIFVLVLLHDWRRAVNNLEAQATGLDPEIQRRFYRLVRRRGAWYCQYCETLQPGRRPTDGLCDKCHQPPAAPVPEELSA